jgi:uncharacterized protein
LAYERALLDSLRNDRLELRLLPTEQCNFRCTYCYETFEHKKMHPTVVAGVKALIDRRAPSLSELHLDWFGGEPMLAPDVITDISRHALAAAAAHGVAFSAGMTTNGYFLDAEGFRRCLADGITDFQISFDGDRDAHDRSRVLGSGAGTFDRIWANTLGMMAVDAEFGVLLRLHYTRENHREVARFARKVHDTFGADPRFRVFFKGIIRLGGPNDASITPISREEDDEILRYLWDESGYGAPAGAAEKVCYAAMANSLVVRSTGRLAKCTVALNDDFNDIGELREDGGIVVDQAKFQRWIAPIVEQRWSVVACPLEWILRQPRAAKAAA